MPHVQPFLRESRHAWDLQFLYIHVFFNHMLSLPFSHPHGKTYQFALHSAGNQKIGILYRIRRKHKTVFELNLLFFCIDYNLRYLHKSFYNFLYVIRAVQICALETSFTIICYVIWFPITKTQNNFVGILFIVDVTYVHFVNFEKIVL